MRAAIYDAFRRPLSVEEVADPEPAADGVVLEVAATGACRSDWHGWMGHDPDIRLPHVPGHEMSGVVVEAGANVKRFRAGDRVTLPFVCGCGLCTQCRSNNAQVCADQTQPGFTHWGSYADLVSVRAADFNVVPLPEGIGHVAAASLGCRFATAYRAVAQQGGLARVPDEGRWLAVYGCGGVGLSAVMIARAFGARVVAIDVDDEALGLAASFGADALLNARSYGDVAQAVHDATGGGAHVSIDALGSSETCINSILGLRRRGTHVQVGLLAGADARPPLPMERVIAYELDLRGSHGMPASRYPQMLNLIENGTLQPERLVTRTVKLEQAARELAQDPPKAPAGVTIIEISEQ